MANFNKVLMIGNLTRDPELRYTPSGLAVATFTVASNRNYTTPSGEKKEQATFMRVVTWGKRAETCGEYLNKGSSVFVDGHLQNRSWQAQDGTKRHAVEIVASNVQFLGSPKGSSNKGGSGSSFDESQIPSGIDQELSIPAQKNNDSQVSPDDDVPF